MKVKLQIASGLLSLVLLAEVSTYLVQNPPALFKIFSRRLSAAAVSNQQTYTCVSTDPNLAVTPTPPPPPPPPPTPPPSPSTSPTPPASPGTVYAGCAVPGTVSGAKTYYVDPVNGSDSADGSQAQPWKSLNSVIAAKVSSQRYVAPYWNSDGSIASGGRTTSINTSGPVHAGDTILLMSGNYGDISISSVNTDFITVKAAPSQFPVLTSLTLTSSAKWVFSGLKIQHLNNRSLSFAGNDPTAGNLVTLSSNGVGGKGGGAVGPVTDIVFTGNLLSSADDTSFWTLDQWKQGTSNAININGLPLPTTPGGGSGGKCIAITHNDISDVNYGIQIGSSDTLVDSNRINHFDSDAIRIQSDNTTVTRNVITNASSFTGVAYTVVAMFSTSPDGNTAYERQNLVFDSNVIIDQTDPNLKYPAPVVGGITMFTNDWDNLNFTNNIVIASAKHDATFFSVHGGICSNNTVIDDGAPDGGGGGGPGLQGLEFGPTGHDRLKGRPSDGVLIMANNLAPNMRTMGQSLAGHTMTVENNVIVRRWEIDESGLYPNIVSQRMDTPGIYPVNNTIDPTSSSYFTKIDTVNKVFDLHVKPSLGAAITKLGAQGPVLEIIPTHSAYHF